MSRSKRQGNANAAQGIFKTPKEQPISSTTEVSSLTQSLVAMFDTLKKPMSALLIKQSNNEISLLRA